MPSPIVKYFAWGHLPPALQVVSKPIGDMANLLDAMLPDSAEKTTGLRKLLEAKDCFVRAQVDASAPGQRPVMEPYQLRVIAELAETRTRLHALLDFISGDNFANVPHAERERMREQAKLMTALAYVLECRVRAFTEGDAA